MSSLTSRVLTVIQVIVFIYFIINYNNEKNLIIIKYLLIDLLFTICSLFLFNFIQQIRSPSPLLSPSKEDRDLLLFDSDG